MFLIPSLPFWHWATAFNHPHGKLILVCVRMFAHKCSRNLLLRSDCVAVPISLLWRCTYLDHNELCRKANECKLTLSSTVLRTKGSNTERAMGGLELMGRSRDDFINVFVNNARATTAMTTTALLLLLLNACN